MNRSCHFSTLMILIWQLPTGLLQAQATLTYFQGGAFYIRHSDSNNSFAFGGESLFSRDHKLVYSLPIRDKHELILGIGTTRMTRQQLLQPTDEGPNISETTLSLNHRIYPVDIGLLRSSGSWTGYGLAASFIGYSRTIYYRTYSPIQGSYSEVRDRLMCYGLGANLIVHGSIIAGARLALLMSIELRYGRILWSDARGRDVSDFRLEYLRLQASFGLGYRHRPSSG